MDAEDLLLRHVLGILEPDDTARAARWIRSQQRADGTWATFGGGPGDLSTTVEAWVALRLAGDPARRPAHAGRGRVRPVPGRGRGHSRVHPDLAVAGRAVVVGRRADDPAGDRAAAAVGAAEHLRLGLLGPADDRAARGGVEHEAGVPGAVRHRRARRRSAPAHRAADRLGSRLRPAGQGAQGVRAAPGPPAAGARGAHGRALDPRPAGGGRFLGRHPAAVGLLADRAAAARARAGLGRDPVRAGRARRVHGPGRPGALGAAADRTGRPVGYAPATATATGTAAGTPPRSPSRRTGRCAGWRPASRRSGTPRSR